MPPHDPSVPQPAEPFNGDRFLKVAVETLVRALGIRTIVETGTNRGDTAVWLATIAATHSIEADPEYHMLARHRLEGGENLILHLGSSPEVIKSLDSQLEGPVLFYLDAHWGDYWPLLDELREISKLPGAVIVIHDFKVPGTNFGFDRYQGKNLDLELIRPVMEQYFEKWGYWYNADSSGARRGVCFLLTGNLCWKP